MEGEAWLDRYRVLYRAASGVDSGCGGERIGDGSFRLPRGYRSAGRHASGLEVWKMGRIGSDRVRLRVVRRMDAHPEGQATAGAELCWLDGVRSSTRHKRGQVADELFTVQERAWALDIRRNAYQEHPMLHPAGK
jgi:hypothetical protein